MEPHTKAVYNKNYRSVKMYKVDVDQNKNLAQEHNIRSTPTVLAFVDGKEGKADEGLQW